MNIFGQCKIRISDLWQFFRKRWLEWEGERATIKALVKTVKQIYIELKTCHTPQATETITVHGLEDFIV